MRFLIKKTPDNFIKSVNDEIATILNRHFDSLYPGYDYDEMSDKQMMPLEIRDKKNEYDIRAELPGVKKEDLDIDLNNNYLTVRAVKSQEKTEDNDTYSKSEFSYGEFSRTVYLPADVETDKIEAKLEHGILKIVIPKLKEEKETVKKITVK